MCPISQLCKQWLKQRRAQRALSDTGGTLHSPAALHSACASFTRAFFCQPMALQVFSGVFRCLQVFSGVFRCPSGAVEACVLRWSRFQVPIHRLDFYNIKRLWGDTWKNTWNSGGKSHIVQGAHPSNGGWGAVFWKCSRQVLFFYRLISR